MEGNPTEGAPSARQARSEGEGTSSPLPSDTEDVLFAISEAARGHHHQRGQLEDREERRSSGGTYISPRTSPALLRAPFAEAFGATLSGSGARPQRVGSTASYEYAREAIETVQHGLDLVRGRSEETAPVMDLREAIRSKSVPNVERALQNSAQSELMAKNAANGAGLLMLAVSMDMVPVFEHLASAIKKRLGTKLLARQLRFEDDKEETLMFYAVASSPAMFSAVKRLVRDTIGRAGLIEQLRHNCAKGTNVLMKASKNKKVFEEVWALLEATNCLDELKDDSDKEGKNWVLYAAEAGNLRVFDKFGHSWEDKCAQLEAEDARGWNGFMYAARGRGVHGVEFLSELRQLCVSRAADPGMLREQLTRSARDADHSTMLTHAAIGGLDSYRLVCEMMQQAGCDGLPDEHHSIVLLSWAAQGGNIAVLTVVAGGIKAQAFPDGDSGGQWYGTSNDPAGTEEKDRILRAVGLCAQMREGVSLFASAIESEESAMISAVAEGIRALVPEPTACWGVLCGDGNPLAKAASKSVDVFNKALCILQEVASLDLTGEAQSQLGNLLLPETEDTPLVSAVYSEQDVLFDHVLETINGLLHDPLTGSMILSQVRDSMRDISEEDKLTQKWISAKMLAKVLEAAKDGGSDSDSGYFNVHDLDNFMQLVAELGAFEHIRALVLVGCHLASHFATLLSKIGIDERNTTECMMIAVTSASNPFVECGVASHAINQATVKRQRDHAALARLQKKIGELALELIEHLPHSVNGVGEELAKGEPDLEPFYDIGKIKPSELLGFVVVGWMLEGSGQSSALDTDSYQRGGLNALAQAVRSGPRALDLLSEALVLDYVDLKFSRTLPSWNDQNPFKHNINQAFYSYTQAVPDAARKREEASPNAVPEMEETSADALRDPEHASPDVAREPGEASPDSVREKNQASSDADRPIGDIFQRLLLLLQGFEFDENSIKSQYRTVFPGLQFTLAGVIGKPVSYYVVPAIRMVFVVISYLATIVLYLSCVTLRSQEIPANEWTFYVIMTAVAWREVLEFSNASKFEPGLGESIERYFLDKWNVLDVLTVVFVFVAFVFRMIELSSGEGSHLFVAQFFLASTAPLLSSRVLFLSQIGRALGPMTQVIFSMLRQLGLFSLVLTLVMLGFAATFSALYGADTVLVEQVDPMTCDINDHPVVYAFGTLGSALLTLFSAMLGEFDLNIFYDRYRGSDGGDCGGVLYEEGGVVLYVTFLVITSITLLNLLIAVLSTAHAEVDQNASKVFQLARAKIILQSGEDVQNDVLPPPFNLIKPVVGLIWPLGSRTNANNDSQLSRWWTITTGALHRLIFAVVVGLGALAVSTVLWMVSFPLVAWKLSIWLAGREARKREEMSAGEQRSPDSSSSSSSSNNETSHLALGRSSVRMSHQPRWRASPSGEDNGDGNGHGRGSQGMSNTHGPLPLSKRWHVHPDSFRDENFPVYVKRVFFLDPEPRRGAISPTNTVSFFVRLLYTLVGAMLAAVSCFFVLPLVSAALWLRGLWTVVQYVQQVRKAEGAWGRRQVDLGEDGEWSIARGHAIKRNMLYRTANSSEREFNVDALLKTTTGMSMEDLRQNMKNLKSTRRQRALGASLDAVLSQFPSEDNP